MRTFEAYVRCVVPAYAKVTVEVADDATPAQIAEALAKAYDDDSNSWALEFEPDYYRAGDYEWVDTELVGLAPGERPRIEVDVYNALVTHHADTLPDYQVD